MPTEISFTREDLFLLVHIQGDPVVGEERLSLFAKMLREASEADLDLLIHITRHFDTA